MEALLLFCVAVVLVTCVWLVARRLDAQQHTAPNAGLPFVWGYFQGLWFFPVGLLWFVFPFVAGDWSMSSLLVVVLYGAFGSWAGYALIRKKRRWAFIAVTLLQANLLTWLINYSYGQTRWKDLT